MTCEEIRELMGADPDAVSAEMQAHLDSCPACRARLSELQQLNVRIRRALQIDPKALELGIGRPQRRFWPARERRGFRSLIDDHARSVPMLERVQSERRRLWVRGLSIGTSLAAGLLVALTLWLSRPTASLASEVVAHVENEPASWSRSEPVSQQQLATVLSRSDVKVGPGLGPVVYASSCQFRGHIVPHLVVRTPSGPVTVMILANEHVPGHEAFQEDGFSGLLVPARTGSVAILSRTPMALEPPAEAVLRALDAANASSSS